MAAATLSLLGFLLSLYLWLWKIGIVGEMACGTGSCETVQLSRYGEIAGIPVAFFGVLGYLGLLVVSLAGLQPRWLNSPGPTQLLALLSGIGVAFTGYLTYVEGAVLHAWCRWCLASAGIIVGIFVAVVVGLVRGRAVTPLGGSRPLIRSSAHPPTVPSPHTSPSTPAPPPSPPA